MNPQTDRTLARIRAAYFSVAAGWLAAAVFSRALDAPKPVILLLLTLALVTATWAVWWGQRMESAVRNQVPRPALVSTSRHRFGLTQVTVTPVGSEEELRFSTWSHGEATGEAATLYGDPATHLAAVAGLRHTFVPLLPRPAPNARPLRKDTSRHLTDGRRIRSAPSNRPDIAQFRGLSNRDSR